MTTHTNREAELETKLMIFHDLVYALGQRGGLKDDDVKKASKDIKQFIRQTHLDLLGEVGQVVKSKKLPVPNPYGTTVKVTRYNQVMDEILSKLSHIITRVEGK